MMHVQLLCPAYDDLHTVSHTPSLEGLGQQHAVLITTDTCANSSKTFFICTSGVHDTQLHEP